MALRIVDNPALHDGLKRQLYAILGGQGFDDHQMLFALARVLTDDSGIYIPPGLFPTPGLICGTMNLILAGLAAVSAATVLTTHVRQSQRGQSALGAAATLTADAVKL